MTENQTALHALNQVLTYVSGHSPYYRAHLREFLDKDGKINRLEDFSKLPFTTKADLSAHNEDFLCVSLNEIADFVTTSGSTGKPVSVYLTAADLDRLAENEFASLSLMGGSSSDIYQLLTTMDKQFMAGLAYYMGVRKLNAGMVRVGPGVPQLHWESILKFKPTKLIAVPSFILSLLDYAKANHIDFQSSSVKAIVCIGEAVRREDFTLNNLGKRITADWQVDLFSTYASTEMGAAFSECEAQNGGHLNTDLLYLEVLKADDTVAEDGETGEIVITTLGVQGMPLVRFRTGDLAQIHYAPCACGRKTPRLGPILGRKNQMIKYKGTTVFPKAIMDILDEFPEIGLYKLEIRKNDLETDEVSILFEERLLNSKVIDKIVQKCQSGLRVLPQFKFMPATDLHESIYQKAKRKPEKIIFID